ncbi:MAG: hypothetical protein ABIH11_02075 [Candidatus Altiarchaeota archaeon]
MKKCVISLGINTPDLPGFPPKVRQDFPKGIKRIRERLDELGFNGDFIGWDKDYPPESPSFEQVPYGSKPFCFKEAYNRGYELVLWVDSSIYLKKSPEPFFDIIRERGYLLINEYHSLGEYCSDDALKTFNISRKESFSIRSCWSGVVGLNLSKEKPFELMSEWCEKAVDGVSFHGARWSGIMGFPVTVSKDPRVKGHRHDQAVLSILAHRLGLTDWMKLKYAEKFLFDDRSYVRKYDESHGVIVKVMDNLRSVRNEIKHRKK